MKRRLRVTNGWTAHVLNLKGTPPWVPYPTLAARTLFCDRVHNVRLPVRRAEAARIGIRIKVARFMLAT